MACNCGRNKRKRVAATNKPKPGTNQDQQQAQQGKTQAFQLITQQGRVVRFGSKLEAEAANIRQGGSGTVRPA